MKKIVNFLALAIGMSVGFGPAEAQGPKGILYDPGGVPPPACNLAPAAQVDTIRIRINRATLMGSGRSVDRIDKATDQTTEANPRPIPNPQFGTDYDSSVDVNAQLASGKWARVKIVLAKGWDFFKTMDITTGNYVQNGIRTPEGNPGALCGPVSYGTNRAGRNFALFAVRYMASSPPTSYNIGIVIQDDDDPSINTPIFIDPKIKDHG